jgi:hypothetical protein
MSTRTITAPSSVDAIAVLIRRFLVQEQPVVWQSIQSASITAPPSVTTHHHSTTITQSGQVTLTDLAFIARHITDWVVGLHSTQHTVTHFYLFPTSPDTLYVGYIHQPS